MSSKSFKRKSAFTAASTEAFQHFEESAPELADISHEGDWTATKVASIIIGLNVIDIIEGYEELLKTDMSEIEREAILLTGIHALSLESAIEVFKRALPLVGTNGDELQETLEELSSELMGELIEDMKSRESDESDEGEEETEYAPDWGDVPRDLIEAVAEEIGLSAEELCERFSFKAVDVRKGRMLNRDDFAKMSLENTVIEGVERIEPKEYHIDDQDEALDDFMKGFE